MTPSILLLALQAYNASSGLYLRTTEDDLDIVGGLISHARVLRFGQLAVLVLMVYDIMITMDREINYFRITSFSPVNLVFFLIRYSAVFRASLAILSLNLDASNTSCKFASWGINLSDWLIIVCIDYALYLRLRALYSLEFRDKKVIKYVLSAFVMESALTLGIVLHETITHHVMATEFLGLSFCVATQAPSEAEPSLLWVSILLYQVTVTTLSVRKAISLHRTLGSRGAHLVKIVAQNQLVYTSLILACGTFALVGTFAAKGFKPLVVIVIYDIVGNTGILPLVGSRMLTQLKEAAEQNPGEGGSLRLPTRASTDVFRTISVRGESAPVLSQESVPHPSEHEN